MQEIQRIKASNKVSLENKFTLKKIQLLDQVQIQINLAQQELQENLLKEKSELINLKAKLISTQKQFDDKNSLIFEQEILISQLMNQLSFKQVEQKQQQLIYADQDQILELENQILKLTQLNERLRIKAIKLCTYFVCLRLYTAELGQKIQDDSYDPNLLTMPKLPDHSHLISSLQESEKQLQTKLEDIKLKEIENENQKLIKDNKNLKRLLQKFNLTENIDTKQQQDQILQLQEQINDQQLLISDYYYKLKQYKDQNQCKKLNDFILKKRKKFDQPVFNLELVKRKLTLDVNRSRDESKQTSLEPRIHSKTIYYKY